MSSALSSPLAVELSFFTVSQPHRKRNEEGKRTLGNEKPAIFGLLLLLIDYLDAPKEMSRGKYTPIPVICDISYNIIL